MAFKIPLIGDFELVKSKTVSNLSKRVNQLEEESLTNRPSLDVLQQYGTEGVRIPFWPLTPQLLYDLVESSDALRTIVINLTREIFRNGAEWKPKFVKKCTNLNCLKEFDYVTELCEDCQFPTRDPDYEQLKYVNKKFEKFTKVNLNTQSMIKVCKMLENDLDTVDDMFLIIVKEYSFDPITGDILKEKYPGENVREFLRGHPINMRIIANKQGIPGFNDSNEPVLICPVHRHALQASNKTHCNCNRKLQQAFFKSVNNANTSSSANEIFYIGGEVFHTNKYKVSLTYGHSPVLTVWQKAITLLNEDRYMMKYYSNMRSPKGILVVPTKNEDFLRKAWNSMMERLKQNPHEIPLFGYDATEGKNQVPTFLNFMNDLQTMQYVEARNQMWSNIGALYGVQPLFLNDVSTSGGLNNEGLQITVTNRAIEVGQQVFNEEVFPFVSNQLGVTDFIYELEPNEEADEMAEIQRDILKAQLAQLMISINYDAFLNEQGEWEFKKKPEQVLSPQISNPLPSSPNANNPIEQDQRFTGEPANVGLMNKSVFSDAKNLEKEITKEFDKALKKLNLKSKPSKTELRELIKSVSRKFKYNAWKSSKKEMENIYKNALNEVENKMNIDIGFNEVDRNAVKALHNDNLYLDAYDDMSKSLSKKLNEEITRVYSEKDFTISKLVNRMQSVADEEEYRLKRIARTESNHISNIARQNSYLKVDKNGEFLYKWIGPDDNRTTDICKSIVEQTQDGVTLSQLKKIVKEQARVHGSEARDLTPHMNCRHTFIRTLANPLMTKAKVYLKPGEKAPENTSPQQGPKGGTFYNESKKPEEQKLPTGHTIISHPSQPNLKEKILNHLYNRFPNLKPLSSPQHSTQQDEHMKELFRQIASSPEKQMQLLGYHLTPEQLKELTTDLSRE